jgi:hypothetical protein
VPYFGTLMMIRRIILLIAVAGIGAVLFLLWLERTYHPPNYSLIEDGLYLGGFEEAPPWGTDAVLNLCETEDPYQCQVHLWEPIPDGAPTPTIDWLRKMVTFIDTQRKQGLTVYVHCRNGASRSGLVVIAYIMFKNNWSREEALAYVHSKRDVTRPNPFFLELLLEWEAAILDSNKTLKSKDGKSKSEAVSPTAK